MYKDLISSCVKKLSMCVDILTNIPISLVECKLNEYCGVTNVDRTRMTAVVAAGLNILHLRSMLIAYPARGGTPKREVSLRPSFAIREIRGTRLLSVERHGERGACTQRATLNIFETLPRIVLRGLKYSTP